MESIEEYAARLAKGKDAASGTSDGAPQNVDPREEFVAALLDGKTYEGASASVGRVYRTTKLWRESDPAFDARCKQAIIDAKCSKLESARVEALDGLRDLIRKRNPAGVIFACKALLGMSETAKLELTGKDGGPVAHAEITDDERAEVIRIAAKVYGDEAS